MAGRTLALRLTEWYCRQECDMSCIKLMCMPGRMTCCSRGQRGGSSEGRKDARYKLQHICRRAGDAQHKAACRRQKPTKHATRAAAVAKGRRSVRSKRMHVLALLHHAGIHTAMRPVHAQAVLPYCSALPNTQALPPPFNPYVAGSCVDRIRVVADCCHIAT
jgi:hypothetical protein